MSRARFNLLLVLLALVVASGSFVAANAAFDGEAADPPPDRSSGDASAPGTSSTSSSTPPVATGDLPSPSWILVVSSDASDEAGAAAVAAGIAAQGHPSGVLRSDDYPSLNPGFWVAYAGPYDGRGAAEAALAEVGADGFTSSYVRCAGTVADCRGQGNGDEGEGDGNGDEDD